MKICMQNEQGRSMIEMLGVLAIIGVLTVGGFSLISKVSTTQKANTLIDEVGALANKTHALFREFVLDNKASASSGEGTDEDSTSGDGTGGSSGFDLGDGTDLGEGTDLGLDSDGSGLGAYIKEAKAYPESLTYDESEKAFINKDDVKISLDYVKDGLDYFTVTVSQLDADMCMAVIQGSWGSPSINGYMGICGGSDSDCSAGAIKNCDDTKTNCKKGGGKLSLDGAASVCNEDSNDNRVVLLFR